MLAQDRNEFAHLVSENDAAVMTLRDSDTSRVQPLGDLDIGDKKTLCLWNRRILPHLERRWIPDPGYYRIDSLRLPVLEFNSSFKATWEGEPAIGQGRLFGDFDIYLEKPPDFLKWYERLVRWIRKNYRKSPTNWGGYLAPAASKFFDDGGYLLPQMLPPITEEWLLEIGKQHSAPNSQK